uniref:peptidyl-prolyl cis-trans isomerase FKBP2 isoform X1 n=1 Tax=Callithrix jacchus TaxID=9483 RepID=UPI00159EA16C|nr:peptidyl-prolyl cis-trans isomerase FKBP2 isoform X1 [Callithrix jacchus]XP_035118989.1 peptidyl-prolyl cis-trans isomerase FKBP2 isoform X1 [Callithrix jacchus]XP_035118990.1 peptidyl-prolyl cis-trans isomerase FKBP2 isoform X1 [Callithrix jacchus]XP_035118991.1 peptidyl-prolyl cis-trans isomerase FKBP2 isoform X1 [Callithrix jacchus]XP_035118992.1 peptidyl-prolyl cis-trans isomerase FKBP2 isoform X1 [Callithrix jacchus]XP_035118993.1 peptidyl-prolyl cis-trans isomerase FKBP2 isoform X1 [C
MRLSWVQVLTVLSICLSAVATATGAEGKRKLQIGVKKRVDHCPIKSRKGDVLHMHYTGKLEDGTEFDSSLPQNQPFVFSLGTGQVIKGWDQGLLGVWRSGSSPKDSRWCNPGVRGGAAQNRATIRAVARLGNWGGAGGEAPIQGPDYSKKTKQKTKTLEAHGVTVCVCGR